MRLLLINPSHGPAIESEAGEAPEVGTGSHPPLGLLYLIPESLAEGV